MITPADSPSAPADYAAVAVSGTDIQAPQADLSAATAGAKSAALARQPETERVLASGQGYGEFDVTGGYTGDWPANTEPGG